MATGNTVTAGYSTDGGLTWNSALLPAAANWNGTAYGKASFISLPTGTTLGVQADTMLTIK